MVTNIPYRNTVVRNINFCSKFDVKTQLFRATVNVTVANDADIGSLKPLLPIPRAGWIWTKSYGCSKQGRFRQSYGESLHP